MEITINIKGLDHLTEALALLGSALAYKNNMIKTSAEAVEVLLETTNKVDDLTAEEEVKKEVVETVVTEVVKVEEEKKVVAEGPPMPTLEDVRKVFTEKSEVKGNREKLKDILIKFEAFNENGMPKVTALKEEQYPAALKALGEI